MYNKFDFAKQQNSWLILINVLCIVTIVLQENTHCHNNSCFLCQHIVFLFKFVIATTIPDIPSEVTLQTRKVTQQSQTDTDLKRGVATIYKVQKS